MDYTLLKHVPLPPPDKINSPVIDHSNLDFRESPVLTQFGLGVDQNNFLSNGAANEHNLRKQWIGALVSPGCILVPVWVSREFSALFEFRESRRRFMGNFNELLSAWQLLPNISIEIHGSQYRLNNKEWLDSAGKSWFTFITIAFYTYSQDQNLRIELFELGSPHQNHTPLFSICL